MKKVTKANIIFTSLILVYMIMIFTVRLIPRQFINVDVLLVLPEVVFLVTALVVERLIKSTSIKDIGFGAISIGTAIKSAGLALLCVPIIAILSNLTSLINGNAAEGAITRVIDKPMWLSLVIMALVPALVEEFVFRGILFSAYKKRNPFKGILLSAFLFGLMHLNINQFSYAFVLGIVFGFMAYATGSIWAGVLMHFVINADSVIKAYLLSNVDLNQIQQNANQTTVDSPFLANIIAYGTIVVIALSCIALGILLFANICSHNRGLKSVTAILKKPLRTNYVDEGKYFDGYLIVGVGICILYILFSDILVKFL